MQALSGCFVSFRFHCHTAFRTIPFICPYDSAYVTLQCPRMASLTVRRAVYFDVNTVVSLCHCCLNDSCV